MQQMYFSLDGFALTGGAGPAQIVTFCLLGEVWVGLNWDIFAKLARFWFRVTFRNGVLMIMYRVFVGSSKRC